MVAGTGLEPVLIRLWAGWIIHYPIPHWLPTAGSEPAWYSADSNVTYTF